MFYLVYISAAVKPFSEEQLVKLLDVSRRNNAGCGITGMLLYKDGKFMQLLEGAKDTVLSLMDKVAADPRHRRVTVLLEGERPGREFEGWSMGFQRLDTPEARELPGYSDLFNVPLDGDALFSSSASECLRMFLKLKSPARTAAPQRENEGKYRYWAPTDAARS
ncbi:MAG: BLUF domain-containing protein [Verrucomicrobia bacterium]|nr:BLUF domain-containing protein [Verrucomicrobiota bacterium]